MGGHHSSSADISDSPKSEKKHKHSTNDSPDNDDSSTVKQVMISYSRKDTEALNILRNALQKSGISTWSDVNQLKAGDDFLSRIGQAVIDCEVFVFLASPSSIQSKFCQDELALAYISKKAIFPVALYPAEELFDVMDTGMRLQLARFEWNFFLDPSEYKEKFDQLLLLIQQALGDTKQDANNVIGPVDIAEKRKMLQRQGSRPALRADPIRMSSLPGGDVSAENSFLATFWQRNFDDAEQVPWFEFVKIFSNEYKDQIEHIFRAEKDKVWLVSILHRELNVTSNTLKKNNFDRFCSTETGEFRPFWLKVQDQAVESYTIREVFNMESSVRVDAIENLGKYKSPAVIEALIDLLSDEDNNVRAVAAISLARTGCRTLRVLEELMKTLDSKDRLVRESGCLSLGHLQVEDAVPKLVQLWRNDFISSVREAASIALEQIGGEQANEAIRMTKLLSEEIHMLTKS
ncbi:uncharacterized protein LOC141899829 isoform X2 [Tubulanus polymorphus]|uniref:uncharacterized protein LOC141899829 isoform X2 n=1 Tax=Tubulanus polymorphus TaxID=672921 RepID=UPI003DA62785